MALTEHFAAAMARLGPFEPRPRLAIAVSGGADSMALALLVRYWAARLNGAVSALTVDHGLRPESAAEADLTLHRLAALGIPGRKLIATGLARGPALAERAREARYGLLLDDCVAAGVPHLLLGHHRSDQVETVMMRALGSSTARGLAGMPALSETRFVRLLRPLLGVPPGHLREWLSARGVAWIEDPSNRDPSARRARLRAVLGDPSGTGAGTEAVARSVRAAGEHRADRDNAIARILAARATFAAEGYVILTPGPIEPEALAALLLTVGGARHAPPIDRVAALARDPRPGTLGGVRIVPAGRLGTVPPTSRSLGNGWLLSREGRAMDGPVSAVRGAVWDGRFRLASGPPDIWRPDTGPTDLAAARAVNDLTMGALGHDATRFRNRDGLPSLVLRGLPALRSRDVLVAVPHLGMGDPRWRILFDPRNRAAGGPFVTGC